MKPFSIDQIKLQADQLVRDAEAAGVVVTIRQQSLEPLRMGNYETVVSVRPVLVQGAK